MQLLEGLALLSLLRFSPIKCFQTSPFDSRLCSGWEKFSPR